MVSFSDLSENSTVISEFKLRGIWTISQFFNDECSCFTFCNWGKTGKLVAIREMASATMLSSPWIWVTCIPNRVFNWRDPAIRVICFAMLLEDEAPLEDQLHAVVLSDKILMVGYVWEAMSGLLFRIRWAIAYVMITAVYSRRFMWVTSSLSNSSSILVSLCGQWMCHINLSSGQNPPAPYLQLSQ